MSMVARWGAIKAERIPGVGNTIPCIIPPPDNALVPKAGLEPARLAAGDFESPASTIPPLGHAGLLPRQSRLSKSIFSL